jgi:lysophospholipase L1-like esterase
MKNYKYIGLLLLSIGVASCDVNNELDIIEAEVIPEVALNKNGLDFSTYISIGTSLTAGQTDSGVFIAAQENSFPNILAGKFGTDFKQPLMNDNIGGFVSGGNVVIPPRLYFNGAGPARLSAIPTTELGAPVTGPFNNYGVPGLNIFHLGLAGYGTLNPYFGRMASSSVATVMGDALAQNPTFFSLEIGGNDILGYATGGGVGTDQTGNFDPATYGDSDITDPNVFATLFSGMVTALTANGAKGVVTNVPNVADTPYFITVPHNPLNPNDEETGPTLKAQIPLLNSIFSSINQIYAGFGEPQRSIVFSQTELNAVVIYDEDATDLSAAITATLGGSAAFVPFVESLGLPAAAAPLVAGLLGQQYGKARSATSSDLLVLPSSVVIGKVNTIAVEALITSSGGLLPANLAGQFSAEGITLPLADKWVLTPQEQVLVQVATDAYNAAINSIVSTNPNIVLGDINGLLTELATGAVFDDYTMTSSLVTGGFFSLDGFHPTSRGYALAANTILAAMDAGFGSNFTTATNGLAKAGDYPTNYSAMLK